VSGCGFPFMEVGAWGRSHDVRWSAGGGCAMIARDVGWQKVGGSADWWARSVIGRERGRRQQLPGSNLGRPMQEREGEREGKRVSRLMWKNGPAGRE
jgi:hypothetical protein